MLPQITPSCKKILSKVAYHESACTFKWEQMVTHSALYFFVDLTLQVQISDRSVRCSRRGKK